MNLEHVEELCLNYLGQAANPLVPLNVLLEHCKRDAQCADLTMTDLKDFLEHHDAVHVLDEAVAKAPDDLDALRSLGVDTGPRAILMTRMPSQAEIIRNIGENLANMMQALNAAFADAGKVKDVNNLEQIREALKRAQDLEAKFRDLF